jgi:hypothetical protein
VQTETEVDPQEDLSSDCRGAILPRPGNAYCNCTVTVTVAETETGPA